jgi:UrcA family protein
MNDLLPKSTAAATVSRPRVTLLMVLCGIAGAAAAGAVSAATTEEAVPRIAVKYDPNSLATDAGAKAVYRRLVLAAREVCPDVFSGSRLVSNVTRQCREEAVARAVQQINNPRLAAIDASHVKTG